MKAQTGEMVRSLPYPAVEEGNSSYPDGEYMVAITPQPDQVSVVMEHSVNGAAFIERLVLEGKAKYGCVVAVPLTGYRRLHLSQEARQKVEWDRSVVGEPPMLRPVIVCVEEFTGTLGAQDGVAEAWQGQEITVPKGARLALKGYLRPNSSLQHLLHVVRRPEFSSGSFEVEACEEEGFYFKVHAADDLFPFLQHPGGYEDHRKSLLTHVASRCFELLARDYGAEEDDGEEKPSWQLFRNLVALEKRIGETGFADVG